MANIKMDTIEIGKHYTAVQLARMWGYKSHHPLVKGMVTPLGTNIILLFVTKEKQADATQYEDEIKGNILFMMGQKKHGSDRRLAENLGTNKDEIYLFYRDLHHTPFTYYGRCFLIKAVMKSDEPSEFQFLIADLDDGLDCEMEIIDFVVNISSEAGENIELLMEGAKKITQHIRYERDPLNRKEAIRIQGHRCKICGFDFDQVYGNDLADSYIEVHHVTQLSYGEQQVDPSKHLLPVCANCHRMLHRKRWNNVTVDQLKENERVRLYQKALSEMRL